jgi:hypothetical protein
VNRAPSLPVSLQDLRRIADTLVALRNRTVTGAVMRSDRRQLRIEMTDGQLLVVGVDLDEGGRPHLEVDVVQPVMEPARQLGMAFADFGPLPSP